MLVACLVLTPLTALAAAPDRGDGIEQAAGENGDEPSSTDPAATAVAETPQTEQVVETKDGQKVTSERRVLPGYVLVQMDLSLIHI